MDFPCSVHISHETLYWFLFEFICSIIHPSTVNVNPNRNAYRSNIH